jgi:hypothetical protein
LVTENIQSFLKALLPFLDASLQPGNHAPNLQNNLS